MTDVSGEQAAALEPTIVVMLARRWFRRFTRSSSLTVPTQKCRTGVRIWARLVGGENLRRFDQAGMPGYLEAGQPDERCAIRPQGFELRGFVQAAPETDPRFSVCGETLRPSDEPVTTVANH